MPRLVYQGNFTQGNLFAALLWAEVSADAAKPGADRAIKELLATTMEREAILVVAQNDKLPVTWRATLYGLAQMGFERLPAFGQVESSLLEDLGKRYVNNDRDDLLTPEDRGRLYEGILRRREIKPTPDPTEQNPTVYDIVSAVPTPESVYENAGDLLARVKRRGSIYVTLVLDRNKRLSQAYDQVTDALRHEAAVPTEPSDAADPAHPDPAHPAPEHPGPHPEGPVHERAL